MFGADAATVCGLAFYPDVEKVLFASRTRPFDPEKGTGYIRETLGGYWICSIPAEGRGGEDLPRELGEDHGEEIVK